MRVFLALGAAFILAGCSATAASSPTPTPKKVQGSQQLGAKFTHYPLMTINKNHRYTAVMVTNDGTFTIQLLPRVAPITVNNFVFLARHHYYDHNLFFRIVQDFMVQTGDPTGTGFGGPGYLFVDEPVRTGYSIGTVAMANFGKNTNGSQFFIVTGPRGTSLPRQFTIFGQVNSGMNVVFKIAHTPVTRNLGNGDLSEPLTPVILKHVFIREST